jgi:hypothetical protein
MRLEFEKTRFLNKSNLLTEMASIPILDANVMQNKKKYYEMRF